MFGRRSDRYTSLYFLQFPSRVVETEKDRACQEHVARIDIAQIEANGGNDGNKGTDSRPRIACVPKELCWGASPWDCVFPRIAPVEDAKNWGRGLGERPAVGSALLARRFH